MAYVFEDKAACCGCGLCKAACPHQAITMTPDEEGFCYPVIDAQRCTNCGACVEACRMDVKQVGDRECIQCGACKSVCEFGAIRFSVDARKRDASPAAPAASDNEANVKTGATPSHGDESKPPRTA